MTVARAAIMGRMPRFVLLFHDCPPSFGKPSHWDLMLERDGALMTWSLTSLPPHWRQSFERDAAGNELLVLGAMRLPDHRLAYLDYEGPLSGDRGRVTRHDAGNYRIVDERADSLQVQLEGVVVRGRVSLPTAPPLPAPDSQPPS